MVWYESARLVHGRVKPLKGKYFENIFIHYMPRSMLWYKSDYNLEYGPPVKNISLEDLIEAEEKKEENDMEERKNKEETEEELSRLLATLSEKGRKKDLADIQFTL